MDCFSITATALSTPTAAKPCEAPVPSGHERRAGDDSPAAGRAPTRAASSTVGAGARQALRPAQWREALSAAAEALKSVKGNELRFIAGRLADLESMAALKVRAHATVVASCGPPHHCAVSSVGAFGSELASGWAQKALHERACATGAREGRDR